MLPNPRNNDEGWAMPGASRKFHYFRKQESICKKWWFVPQDGYQVMDDLIAGPEDCAACVRKLQKERAKKS